jgi:hypothetical protein
MISSIISKYKWHTSKVTIKKRKVSSKEEFPKQKKKLHGSSE